MSAGYRLCRKCGYDFVSNGPHDRVCEDCLKPRKPPVTRKLPVTAPAPLSVDMSPEAQAARWTLMERIVRGH